MTSNDLRRVTVIGCGLIGTSIALALTRAGVEVALEDRDTEALMQAQLMGAGRELEPHAAPADVVVIATPPAAVVDALYDAQTRALGYAYTDVAGVKELIWNEAELRACDLMGYVPGHPMAGREQSGPGAAEADLFAGRPWILCPYPTSQPEAVEAVAELVTLCGGIRRDMAPEEHDEAVAAVSHVPHLISSVLAAQLTDVADDILAMGDSGLWDTTRIAAGDRRMWSDIFTQNPEAVGAVIDRIATELAAAARELRDPHSDGSAVVDDVLRRGNHGRAALERADLFARSGAAGRVPVFRTPDEDNEHLTGDAYADGMMAVSELIAAVESGVDIMVGATKDTEQEGATSDAGHSVTTGGEGGDSGMAGAADAEGSDTAEANADRGAAGEGTAAAANDGTDTDGATDAGERPDGRAEGRASGRGACGPGDTPRAGAEAGRAGRPDRQDGAGTHRASATARPHSGERAGQVPRHRRDAG